MAWKTEGASGSESAEETVCDGNEVTEVAEEDGCQRTNQAGMGASLLDCKKKNQSDGDILAKIRTSTVWQMEI